MVNPTYFPIQSEMACTIPSPGLGMIRMFRDMAAPIPVRMIPGGSEPEVWMAYCQRVSEAVRKTDS